ncbi:hypothetical protein AAG570_014181 [Ranatra chinensis]|uniref:Sterol 3-beta-glucosyltransferase n=1 Tax=Ranatra chinensis TaxID=642074 RepID=A0ABD0XS58_9HEMI
MITILCSGSRGDIQPYLALAQEIKKLGKGVRIAAGKSFADFVAGYEIDFYPLSADYKSVDIDPKLIKAAQNSTNPLKMMLTFNKMKKYAKLVVDEMYEACQGSDLIVYHPGCTIGYFAAEEMQVPSILASPFPMLETKEVASIIAYGKTRLPIKLTYKLMQGMLWTASKTGVELFWKEKYGKLPRNWGCPFERVDARHPSIVSCSNFVFSRPTDWDKNIYQYGYWFLKENDDYKPPVELTDFLAKGEKPIYFGFGSVFSSKDKDNYVKWVTEALENTGNRGIICGMGSIESLPSNILAIDSIPHTWLFPKCSAVCHHGGAGTSATGFAAGVPSIIVPFSNDQFAWAHRAFDIGVGSKPIYKKRLSTKRLSEAIDFSLSKEIVENARKLQENIASENGARDCAAVIVKLAN